MGDEILPTTARPSSTGRIADGTGRITIGPSASRQICLFAVFDPQHRIRRHVLDYLAALRLSGYEVVVGFSGVRPPPEVDQDALRKLGVHLHVRPNGGLDFGAWRDLLNAGHADGASSVLLANDSVFGPFFELKSIVDRMNAAEYDAWGMVESWQRSWHLQSWFIQLSAAALAAPRIREIFDQRFETMTKAIVIERGEIALGAAMRAEGLRCKAVYQYADMAFAARLIPTNPMHIDWRMILVSRRLPFLKRELVQVNPLGIPWANEWPFVLRKYFDYPVEMIQEYLHDLSQDTATSQIASFPPQRNVSFLILFLYILLTRDHWHAIRATIKDML